MQTSYPPSGRMNGNATASLIIGIMSWAILPCTAALNATGSMMILRTGALSQETGALAYIICASIIMLVSPLGWLIGTMLGYTARNRIRRTGEGGAFMASAGCIINLTGLILMALFICGSLAIVISNGTIDIGQYLGIPSY